MNVSVLLPASYWTRILAPPKTTAMAGARYQNPGRQIATEDTAELRVVFRDGSGYGPMEKKFRNTMYTSSVIFPRCNFTWNNATGKLPGIATENFDDTVVGPTVIE